MKKIILFLISILFPKICSLCGQNLHFASKESLCKKCSESLELNNGFVCHKCSLPLSDGGAHCRDCKNSKEIYFEKLVAPYIYEGKIKKLIRKLKYSKATFLAYDLSQGIINLIKKEKFISEIDIVAEVPMHALKKFRRGYNQAYLMARYISKALNKPLLSDIVKRRKNTKALAGLKRKERIKNLEDVFCINKKYIESIKNKTILIVDDIATSCTTVNMCAEIMKQSGVKKVYVAAAARAVEHV